MMLLEDCENQRIYIIRDEQSRKSLSQRFPEINIPLINSLPNQRYNLISIYSKKPGLAKITLRFKEHEPPHSSVWGRDIIIKDLSTELTLQQVIDNHQLEGKSGNHQLEGKSGMRSSYYFLDNLCLRREFKLSLYNIKDGDVIDCYRFYQKIPLTRQLIIDCGKHGQETYLHSTTIEKVRYTLQRGDLYFFNQQIFQKIPNQLDFPRLECVKLQFRLAEEIFTNFNLQRHIPHLESDNEKITIVVKIEAEKAPYSTLFKINKRIKLSELHETIKCRYGERSKKEFLFSNDCSLGKECDRNQSLEDLNVLDGDTLWFGEEDWWKKKGKKEKSPIHYTFEQFEVQIEEKDQILNRVQMRQLPGSPKKIKPVPPIKYIQYNEEIGTEKKHKIIRPGLNISLKCQNDRCALFKTGAYHLIELARNQSYPVDDLINKQNLKCFHCNQEYGNQEKDLFLMRCKYKHNGYQRIAGDIEPYRYGPADSIELID